MALSWASKRSPISLFLGNKFGKKYFTLCITMHMLRVCMTQRYEMICFAHDLLPDHAQKLLKTKEKETHLSLNLIFLFFSNFHFLVESHYPDHPLFNKYFFVKKNWIWHSFSQFFVKHHPITRKKQNEKLFFVFFHEFKTHFFVFTWVKFSSPNDIMKFINTKTRKLFFWFFLQKTITHMYLLYYQPTKEILEQRCLFTCPKFG